MNNQIQITDRYNAFLTASLVFFGSLLLIGGVSTLLYAEEGVATPDATAVTQPAAHGRVERIQNFLENHPKLKDRIDANDDGTVDKHEMKHARKFRQQMKQRHHHQNQGGYDQQNYDPQNQGGYYQDYDNNPPGYTGGPGTNWERNDFRQQDYRRDFDNNPPGQQGGPGTNWENRPGPQGGSGFGRDRDNNPPGQAGGRGTNWENRPGPQGGSGASPNRGGHGRRG